MSIFNRKAKQVKAENAEKAIVTSQAKTVASAVLLRPVITEKQTLSGVYAFEVAPTTNKSEIAKAVEVLFGVAPVSVRIINVIGKKVRAKKGEGQRKDWKKAIVRLPQGKTINVYEGM